MSETEKGWTGLARDFFKSPPAILFVAGVLFVALAVTTELGTKEYQVAAQNDVWRTVSARIGVLLIVVGIVFYWRVDISKRPGPYTTFGNYPLRIEGPNDPIIVTRDRQPFKVRGIRKGSEWLQYRVMLMHTGEKWVSPGFEHLDYRALARGEFSWEAEVRLPELERITKEENWRLAFFYVGPNAQRLIDHHEAVCKYFAPDGKPKSWPPIENPPDELVQCSDVLKVSFGPEPPKMINIDIDLRRGDRIIATGGQVSTRPPNT